jgi:hypothetical protein
MELRKFKLREVIKEFFKNSKFKEDNSSLDARVKEVRSRARVNPGTDEKKCGEKIKKSGSKNGSNKDQPSSELRQKKRPSARRSHRPTLPSSNRSGVNLMDAPFDGQEAKRMNSAGLPLPPELIDEINRFSSMAHKARLDAEHFKKFGIDLDTATEMKRILDQNTIFKNAVSQLPDLLKKLNGPPGSPGVFLSGLKGVVARISIIPDFPTELKEQIEAKMGAIVLATNLNDRKEAVMNFWKMLSAVGIRMY